MTRKQATEKAQKIAAKLGPEWRCVVHGPGIDWITLRNGRVELETTKVADYWYADLLDSDLDSVHAQSPRAALRKLLRAVEHAEKIARRNLAAVQTAMGLDAPKR